MAIFYLIFAAFLEVAGDAAIRSGIKGPHKVLITYGCLALAAYGLFVNLTKLDFTRLMGIYVAVFTLMSVLFGLLVFGDKPSLTTVIGVLIILSGAALIRFG